MEVYNFDNLVPGLRTIADIKHHYDPTNLPNLAMVEGDLIFNFLCIVHSAEVVSFASKKQGEMIWMLDLQVYDDSLLNEAQSSSGRNGHKAGQNTLHLKLWGDNVNFVYRHVLIPGACVLFTSLRCGCDTYNNSRLYLHPEHTAGTRVYAITTIDLSSSPLLQAERQKKRQKTNEPGHKDSGCESKGDPSDHGDDDILALMLYDRRSSSMHTYKLYPGKADALVQRLRIFLAYHHTLNKRLPGGLNSNSNSNRSVYVDDLQQAAHRELSGKDLSICMHLPVEILRCVVKGRDGGGDSGDGNKCTWSFHNAFKTTTGFHSAGNEISLLLTDLCNYEAVVAINNKDTLHTLQKSITTALGMPMLKSSWETPLPASNRTEDNMGGDASVNSQESSVSTADGEYRIVKIEQLVVFFTHLHGHKSTRVPSKDPTIQGAHGTSTTDESIEMRGKVEAGVNLGGIGNAGKGVSGHGGGRRVAMVEIMNELHAGGGSTMLLVRDQPTNGNQNGKGILNGKDGGNGTRDASWSEFCQLVMDPFLAQVRIVTVQVSLEDVCVEYGRGYAGGERSVKEFVSLLEMKRKREANDRPSCGAVLSQEEVGNVLKSWLPPIEKLLAVKRNAHGVGRTTQCRCMQPLYSTNVCGEGSDDDNNNNNNEDDDDEGVCCGIEQPPCVTYNDAMLLITAPLAVNRHASTGHSSCLGDGSKKQLDMEMEMAMKNAKETETVLSASAPTDLHPATPTPQSIAATQAFYDAFSQPCELPGVYDRGEGSQRFGGGDEGVESQRSQGGLNSQLMPPPSVSSPSPHHRSHYTSTAGNDGDMGTNPHMDPYPHDTVGTGTVIPVVVKDETLAKYIFSHIPASLVAVSATARYVKQKLSSDTCALQEGVLKELQRQVAALPSYDYAAAVDSLVQALFLSVASSHLSSQTKTCGSNTDRGHDGDCRQGGKGGYGTGKPMMLRMTIVVIPAHQSGSPGTQIGRNKCLAQAIQFSPTPTQPTYLP